MQNWVGSCDFSLYFFGDYAEQDRPDKYELITFVSRFADRHGFLAIWLPERHFHSFGGLFPNPSVLAAALAAQTERIRRHAGSVVLPLHNPTGWRREWSVDNLSGGRVGLCVASGWHATNFALAPENFPTGQGITLAEVSPTSSPAGEPTVQEIMWGTTSRSRSAAGPSGG